MGVIDKFRIKGILRLKSSPSCNKGSFLWKSKTTTITINFSSLNFLSTQTDFLLYGPNRRSDQEVCYKSGSISDYMINFPRVFRRVD